MKKLITWLKNLFCGSAEHTETTAPQADWSENDSTCPSYVAPAPVIEEEAAVEETKEAFVEAPVEEVTVAETVEEDAYAEEPGNEADECNEESCEEDCECECEGCPCDEDCEVECCECTYKKCIVEKELAVWGLNPNNMNYKAILAMTEITDVACDYNSILTAIADVFGKAKGSLSTSLKAATVAANFGASEYDMIKELVGNEDYKAIIVAIYSWISSL